MSYNIEEREMLEAKANRTVIGSDNNKFTRN
jgi:hypothetical protein